MLPENPNNNSQESENNNKISDLIFQRLEYDVIPELVLQEPQELVNSVIPELVIYEPHDSLINLDFQQLQETVISATADLILYKPQTIDNSITELFLKQPQGIISNTIADFVPYEHVNDSLISLDLLQPKELLSSTMADIILRESEKLTFVIGLNDSLGKYNDLGIELNAINLRSLNEIIDLNTANNSSEVLGVSNPDEVELG